jgi:hypothetical protein
MIGGAAVPGCGVVRGGVLVAGSLVVDRWRRCWIAGGAVDRLFVWNYYSNLGKW